MNNIGGVGMGAVRKKNDNIHIRVKPEQKELISKAAELLGLDLTTFILQNSLKAANSELAKLKKLSLDNIDANIFFEAIMNSKEPNDNLKDAYEKYNKNFLSD